MSENAMLRDEGSDGCARSAGGETRAGKSSGADCEPADPFSPASAAIERRFVLHNDPEEIAEAQRALFEAVTAFHHDAASCFAIRLALEEALSNAYKHGNRERPDQTVVFQFVVDRSSVVIEVQDEGQGFDPGAVPDPTEPENVEIPSGRGIVLMRAYMSDVTFLPPGNRVRMVYRRPTSA